MAAVRNFVELYSFWMSQVVPEGFRLRYLNHVSYRIRAVYLVLFGFIVLRMASKIL